jgi:hypothetical protein
MSQENAEIIRGFRGCWDRGDFATRDALDPQAEFARIGRAAEMMRAPANGCYLNVNKRATGTSVRARRA